jgi:hypothetical protein
MKAGTLNMTNCFGVGFLWTPKTYSNCKKKGPYKQAFTFKISLLFNHLLQDLPLEKVTKQQTTDLLQIYQSKKNDLSSLYIYICNKIQQKHWNVLIQGKKNNRKFKPKNM